MTQQRAHRLVFVILFLSHLPICLATESTAPSDPNRYLNAVRTFADNVLMYGRDTYGPQHTPLFVDGLNIHTHEPVKWISPEGNVLKIRQPVDMKEWILSNFACQQTLLRTLDGLSEITGAPKYRDAAKGAIKYAFENLRFNNGLFYWGHVAAYDALEDKVWGNTHSFKMHYPHYELMWEVNPDETKRFIEAYWSAHVIDWSNLDFNRIGDVSDVLPKPWDHEYKGGPTFFKSKTGAGGFFHTGTSLAHAGTMLSRLSGQEQPFVWSQRLMKRFIDTRHPKTGISAYQYNRPLRKITGDDIEEHFADPHTGIFPFYPWDLKLYHGQNVQPLQWISLLLVGDILDDRSKEFTQWAIEEFTAWAKASYRKSDNVFIPILTDGTNLDGYMFKEDCELGFKGTVLKPLFADLRYFWAYSVGYRMTSDEFMWEMARDITIGNNLGDIGQVRGYKSELKMETACSDVYGLLGFLELYSKTHDSAFLSMAKLIADNIVDTKFHSGFFVKSKKHIYANFDCLEPLALLHLAALIESKPPSIPQLWPCSPLFVPPYRYKQIGDYPRTIYSLTGSPEVPLSLQEAAAVGDIETVRSVLNNKTNVDSIDDSFGKTALHRAAISGHTNIAKLLIDSGARLDAKTGGSTALHYAIEYGHKDMVRLLLNCGADINAKNDKDKTPIELVGRRNRQEIINLLKKHGATGEPPQTMMERFQSMSDEERQRFRDEMRKRFEARKEQEKKE
jgi:pectate lyase